MSETIKCYNGEVNLKYINEIMKKEYRYNVNKEYYLSKDLIYKKIVEGIVLPYKKKKLTLSYNGKGGVITKNHKYVMESAALAFNGMDDRMCGKYHFTKCNTINEEVIYFGNFQPQWGHFLVDWIVRVWFVLENDNSDQKIVYIGKEIQGNYLEFLKLLGIDEKRLMRIDVPTRFKTIIVPEPSHLPGKY